MHGLHLLQAQEALTAEKIFLQERTYPQYVRGEHTEGHYQQSDGQGGSGVKDEVVTIHPEELTHHRQLRQEEIMEQIDIKCTTTDELQRLSKTCLFEEIMVIPEEHEYHRQQEEHRQRMGE